MTHKLTRPDLVLILFALLVVGAIVMLIALHDGVPPELWAIVFAALGAAGVAIVPTAQQAPDVAVIPAADPAPPSDATAPLPAVVVAPAPPPQGPQ